MNKRNARVIMFGVLFLISATVLYADELSQEESYQCPRGIVSFGDTERDVFEKCGEPTLKTEEGRKWVYDRGPSFFVYYIKFDSGSVLRIYSGGYGK